MARYDDEELTVEVTAAMIEAGEAVLDRACELAEIVPSIFLTMAVKDIYIAMEKERCSQVLYEMAPEL
jgi:hypothetical protein